jgi:hypothetical protein
MTDLTAEELVEIDAAYDEIVRSMPRPECDRVVRESGLVWLMKGERPVMVLSESEFERIGEAVKGK